MRPQRYLIIAVVTSFVLRSMLLQLGMTKNDVLAGVISKASSASTLTDQPHRKAMSTNGHSREKGVVDEPPEKPTENLKIKPSSFGQRRYVQRFSTL